MLRDKNVRSVRALLVAVGFSIAALCTALNIDAAPPTPEQILERADRIRFPKEAFQVGITIDSTSPRRGETQHAYRVLVKGNENSIVQTLSPAAEKGQILLMKGFDLWVFLPRVSQPVRLPLSQRLTGQVANGDIARANFSGDYNVKLLRKASEGGKNYYVLELTAAKRGVTYHRVLFWVEVDSYRPYRAEFYSKSKRLLKVGHYKTFKKMAGAIRPSQLVLEDALKKDTRSVLRYKDMKLRELPDRYFTKQFLKKLR